MSRIYIRGLTAPDPLPPIQFDEIHLVRWLAIEREPPG